MITDLRYAISENAVSGRRCTRFTDAYLTTQEARLLDSNRSGMELINDYVGPPWSIYLAATSDGTKIRSVCKFSETGLHRMMVDESRFLPISRELFDESGGHPPRMRRHPPTQRRRNCPNLQQLYHKSQLWPYQRLRASLDYRPLQGGLPAESGNTADLKRALCEIRSEVEPRSH